MELIKLQTDELRNFEAAKLKEVEDNARKELFKIRMDIYTPKASQAGNLRGLRKTLARVKTIQTEKRRTQELKTKAPAAKKAVETPVKKKK